jgi:hypothetical protein
MLRIYTTADAFSLSDVSRKTIKSRFRTTPSNVVTVDGPLLLLHRSIDRSIDRSIELCVVSFNVAPHQMSASSLAFSNRENMHFRSTASTALRNSLLTLRSRRPFEPVFFFFFVLLERDLGTDRHLALT